MEDEIPVGRMGDVYKGICIIEHNRATVWERWPSAVQALLDFRDNNYRNKGVHAVVYGVTRKGGGVSYAVFVEEGFLI